jgi:hydrogenase-4 component E
VERLGDALLLLVLLTDLALLVTDRLSSSIRLVALQGVLLGLVPLTLAHGFSVHLAAIVTGTIAIKAVLLPRILLWAIREAEVRHERRPSIGHLPSLLLGLAVTGIAFGVSGRLPALPGHSLPLLIPVALATLMIGFLLLTTRRKALSQVLGYLVLENGIFLFGLTLADRLPLLVEMGVLLDVFVGALIMGLVVFQIQRELETLDSRELSQLTD